MKKLIFTLALSAAIFSVQATEKENNPVKVTENVDGQQVRFYNECGSSATFYVKSSGGTSSYSVGSKSSKNVSVNVGDKILDSSRNEIVTIESGTSKVVICD